MDQDQETALGLLNEGLRVRGVNGAFLVHGIDIEGMTAAFTTYQISQAKAPVGAWEKAREILSIVEARDELARTTTTAMKIAIRGHDWHTLDVAASNLAEQEIMSTGLGPWYDLHVFAKGMVDR